MAGCFTHDAVLLLVQATMKFRAWLPGCTTAWPEGVSMLGVVAAGYDKNVAFPVLSPFEIVYKPVLMFTLNCHYGEMSHTSS